MNSNTKCLVLFVSIILPTVFEEPSVKSVIFEWAGLSNNCNEQEFKRVLQLLRKNGFKLYLLSNRDLKPSDSLPDDQLMEMKGPNFFWTRIDLEFLPIF